MIRRVITLLCAGAFALNASAQTRLNGAGSTFVNPIMSKWSSEYNKEKGVEINYQSVGSGAGISQVSIGTVDFGATDGPMTDEQLAAAKTGKIIHIPMVMGADVPAYNIPGVTQKLRFTPQALAGIFMGKITSWNDPQIAHANPNVKLPASTIVVVHRSDGSGTTYIWTDYLAKVSPEWKSRVGTGTSVKWPVGIGAKGNEGVAGMIRQTEGSVGYVELIYAVHNNITYGQVQNASGAFIDASIESVTAAAASAKIPNDFRYSITNPAGKAAFPIAGTTWMLVPVSAGDTTRRHAVRDFAEWVITKGQSYCQDLSYAKLPATLVMRLQQSLKQIQ